MTQNNQQTQLHTFDWNNASWEEIMSLVRDGNKIIYDEGQKPATHMAQYDQLCNKFEDVKIALGYGDIERSRDRLRLFFDYCLTDYIPAVAV